MPDWLKIILIFAVVLYGAYYFSKLMASFQNGYSKSRYMKIADRLVLAKDKSIALITVGEKNIMVSITNDGIKIIKEIDQADMIPIENDIKDSNSILPSNHLIVESLIKKSVNYIKSTYNKTRNNNDKSVGNAFGAILNKQIVVKNMTNDLGDNVNDN